MASLCFFVKWKGTFLIEWYVKIIYYIYLTFQRKFTMHGLDSTAIDMYVWVDGEEGNEI